MLALVVVKIELWPQGQENEAQEIGRMFVANDATGTVEIGDYDVELLHGGEFYGKPGVWKKGKVLRFVRKLSPYHLVQRALDAALGRSTGASSSPAPARVSSDTKPCKGCGQQIRWTRTPQGRAMPLDPEPIPVTLDPRGPLTVVLEDGNVKKARKHEGTDVYEPVMARVSHFATCVEADRFRGGAQ
jgi:hypothetical protein